MKLCKSSTETEYKSLSADTVDKCVDYIFVKMESNIVTTNTYEFK